jgi:hypothetical protein
MKRNLHKGLYILMLSISFTTGCKKTLNNTDVTPTSAGSAILHDSTLTAVNTTQTPYPITPVQECIYTPNYGDSIVYPQPSGSDYYIYPQNTNGLKGTYFSWPAGLSLNPNTGAIDLSTSQTGQRYDMAFIQYGTTDTCVSQLIVAGTSYMDSVYVLSKSDTSSDPYFNANPYAPNPCWNKKGPGACQFDYNGFARLQGVVVNRQTGFIDLQNTFRNVFGRFPFNGETITTTIFYKINDNSDNAIQQIQLKLMYYDRKANVPSAVLSTISNNENSTLNNQLLSKGPSPRPPLILIVRNN